MTTVAPSVAPSGPKMDRLPPFAVVLHNDDRNEMAFVVQSVSQIVRMPVQDAYERMIEAHNQGQAVVLQTHREHAEFVCEAWQSKGLVATVERSRG